MLRKLLLKANVVKPKTVDELVLKNQALGRKQDKIMHKRIALRKQIDALLPKVD